MVNDTEIEIKVQLDEASFLKIKERVKNITFHEGKLSQVDQYYTPPHRDFTSPKLPFEWLRIRRVENKSFLTYKHHYPEDSEERTHCDEFETELKSAEPVQKIFEALNFRPLVIVEKEREVYNFRGEFEILFDTVKDLGYFVEVEAKKDFGSVEETRKKILELAKSIGLDASKISRGGYALQLMKAKGLIKS